MNFKLCTCREEYSKDPKIKKSDIKKLSQWVDEESRMPKVTEFMLIQCYHVCDYDFEKAKRLVRLLYEYKNEAPELFSGRDFQPPKYHHTFFDKSYIFVIPQTTPEGYRIIYTGLRDLDASKYDCEIIFAMTIKTMFLIIMEQGVCPGYICVSDSHGTNFAHYMKMSLSMLRKILHFSQEVIPIKLKCIHIVNSHWLTKKIITIANQFLRKETQELFHMHTDMNNFYKVISRDLLPKDIGGNLPYTRDELNELTRAKMEVFSDAIDAELALRSSS